MTATWIARRCPEYGWAPFDRKTGEKLVGDDKGPWWPSRKAVVRAMEAKETSE